MVLSEKTEDTGSFFGRIDGTIMDSLVQDRIYRRVAFMNYQGTCSDGSDSSIAAGKSITPTIVAWFIDHVVAFGVAWLGLMPGSSLGWASDRYGDSYDDADLSEMDDYSPDYDPGEDYPFNEIVTAPEIVIINITLDDIG